MQRHQKKAARQRNGRHVKRSLKSGLAPGTPVFVGQRKQEEVQVDAIRYTRDHVQELRLSDAAAFPPPSGEDGVTWININGVHDVHAIERVAAHYKLHPLTLEDIVNTGQRPKAEEFEDYLFIVLKMLSFDENKGAIDIENVSLVLGDGFVLSFQERSGDLFDGVRERLRAGKGKLRQSGADYLAYSLMDAVLDGYFIAIEKLGDHIEELDDEILTRPASTHMQRLHRLKREVLFLRKSVWPLREEISLLEKSETPLIRPQTRAFLRDLHDHSVQALDMVETYRDIIGGMHDTFLSSISNRMNEIMKVLTLIATVFIPLTFIAGVYGMNFRYMPELEWRYGYFVVLGGMGLLGIGLLVWFRKRGWL